MTIKCLDLAVLKPLSTMKEVMAAAKLVDKHGLATVCVTPDAITSARFYTGRIAAVIGYPTGRTLPYVKLKEAKLAIEMGAVELDVVINYGQFLQGWHNRVENELIPIVRLAHQHGVKVKAILEACYYSEAQLFEACELCVDCVVDWVKTSTGVVGGATPEMVKTMIQAVDGRCGVKASGGIKTTEQAQMYLDLGCTRIGASVLL